MIIFYTNVKKSWISASTVLLLICLSELLSAIIEGTELLETPKKDNMETNELLEFSYKFAGLDSDSEYRLAYFREDMAVAVSHMHFHFTLPLWSPEIPNRRGGEMFYYYHQQLIARYDAERISVGLSRVVPYSDLHQPIIEGYFPNIPDKATAIQYNNRLANSTIADVPGIYYVDELITWHDHIMKAAENGIIIQKNGTELYINHPEGISVLGDVIQSLKDSANVPFYGCYHKTFHKIIGKISDPKGDKEDLPSAFYVVVMDPLLYRYHKHVDDIFVSLKKLNPIYEKTELSWRDVELQSISIEGDLTKVNNELTTYTQEWKPLISHGLDFISNVPIRVLFKILQHEEFSYHLEVNNFKKENITATVRLFLAPIYDATDIKIPFQEQRRLFIALDRYKVVLNPGKQNITRHSTQSTVTIPLETTTQLMSITPIVNNNAAIGDPCMWSHTKFDETRFKKDPLWIHSPFEAGVAHKYCGWPHHLLIPRGNKTGVKFLLYAMLTDWQNDKAQSIYDQDFKKASVYCGNFNETYPDKQSLGFPFDRFVQEGTTLDSFLQHNMAIATITIYHSDKIVQLNEYNKSFIL